MKHIKDEIKKIMENVVVEKLEASFEDWKAYKDVQSSGSFNMLSPMAIEMSGLEEEVYFDIIENYSEYEKLYGQRLFD